MRKGLKTCFDVEIEVRHVTETLKPSRWPWFRYLRPQDVPDPAAWRLSDDTNRHVLTVAAASTENAAYQAAGVAMRLFAHARSLRILSIQPTRPKPPCELRIFCRKGWFYHRGRAPWRANRNNLFGAYAISQSQSLGQVTALIAPSQQRRP